MNNSLKNQVIESLKDQKAIFGDELFEDNLSRRTDVQSTLKAEEKIKQKKITVPLKKKEDEEDFFEEPKEQWENTTNLNDLNNLIGNCLKCPLGSTRNKFVFGSGNPEADVMVIGEGPGADEDAQGLPFVGRAGKLLTDILKAINFSRDEVYIANVVKCRPPGNRTPYPQEMDTCLPYLSKQVELIKPRLILCLGLTAAQGLLKKKDSLTNMRGKVFELDSKGFNGIKAMVTYHPAALLRNPNWKRGCWEDVQKFRKLYDKTA